MGKGGGGRVGGSGKVGRVTKNDKRSNGLLAGVSAEGG